MRAILGQLRFFSCCLSWPPAKVYPRAWSHVCHVVQVYPPLLLRSQAFRHLHDQVYQQRRSSPYLFLHSIRLSVCSEKQHQQPISTRPVRAFFSLRLCSLRSKTRTKVRPLSRACAGRCTHCTRACSVEISDVTLSRSRTAVAFSS